MTKAMLLMAVVGAFCFVWVNATNCASFALPDPTATTPSGNPSTATTRVLWGESYCKELTLKDLDGKKPKLCVRNKRPINNTPRGCMRIILENIDTTLIKEVRLAIHPDCDSVPAEGSADRFEKIRIAADPAAGQQLRATGLCFDRIPASESCCETERCLLFEAVIDVAGVDTVVTIDDGSCSSVEGCPYSIGCPNLINEVASSNGVSNYFDGTDSNDLFILPEPDMDRNYVRPYEGYDYVVGSNGRDFVNGINAGGGITASLRDGDDIFFTSNDVDKVYFGGGDDYLYFISNDGIEDRFDGGKGTNTYGAISGALDSNDILDEFVPS